jgi:hypothetical protein
MTMRRTIAGACNHPNLLVLPLRLELIRLALGQRARSEIDDRFRVAFVDTELNLAEPDVGEIGN